LSPSAKDNYWQRLKSIIPRVIDDREFHIVAVGHQKFCGSATNDQFTISMQKRYILELMVVIGDGGCLVSLVALLHKESSQLR